jgi:hypothetical protein
LKDFFEEYFKEHQKLIVTFRVITKRNSGGRKKRIYQFNIYDCMNKKLYFGFGKERNIKNLCSFISHVIDGLKDKNMIRDDAYISSNLKYLKQLSCENSHYHKNVYSKHRLPLLIENNKHLLRSRINKLDYSNNEKGLMVSAYEDMILNSENVLLIHPSVVDCGDRKGSLDSFVKLNSTGVMKETMKLI